MLYILNENIMNGNWYIFVFIVIDDDDEFMFYEL